MSDTNLAKCLSCGGYRRANGDHTTLEAELANVRRARDAITDHLTEVEDERDRLRASNTSLVEGAKRDSATIARLRRDYAEARVAYNEKADEAATKLDGLREGHRVCEENMDAEIDRLREENNMLNAALDEVGTEPEELARLRGSVALAEHHTMLALNALKEIT